MTESDYEARSLQPLKQRSSLRQHDSSGGNPKQWSPDVNMLLSTSRWLEVYLNKTRPKAIFAWVSFILLSTCRNTG